MKVYRRLKARIEFEPRDLWIGVYWDRKKIGTLSQLNLYICIVPVFPIHLTYIFGKLPELRRRK